MNSKSKNKTDLDKYDDKGNVIETNDYNPDGSLETKWTHLCKYDDIGNWIDRKTLIDNIPKYISERELYYYQ